MFMFFRTLKNFCTFKTPSPPNIARISAEKVPESSPQKNSFNIHSLIGSADKKATRLIGQPITASQSSKSNAVIGQTKNPAQIIRQSDHSRPSTSNPPQPTHTNNINKINNNINKIKNNLENQGQDWRPWNTGKNSGPIPPNISSQKRKNSGKS